MISNNEERKGIDASGAESIKKYYLVEIWRYDENNVPFTTESFCVKASTAPTPGKINDIFEDRLNEYNGDAKACLKYEMSEEEALEEFGEDIIEI